MGKEKKIPNPFLIVTLTIVFCVVFFSSFNAFSHAYYQSQNSSSGTIALGGTNVKFTVSDIIFDGVQVTMGETVSYPISVVNANNKENTNTIGLIDCYLRIKTEFKVNSHSVDYVMPNLYAPNNWLVGSDGYIYYKNVFKVGDLVQVYDSFDISSEVSEIAILNGIDVEITAETVQADGKTYKTEWIGAPNIW